ncbi:MAG TPA: lysophospholipid acyltransferase family protein [Pirellulales bacterium]|jgi:1-acyl-sn-glycerol-3-phosphate acyltransferase|nr:lysophospholipid acyltransferase family protein [Pirellulales bacterium]
MLSPANTAVLACVVLVVLIATLVTWIVRIYRRTSFTLAQFPVYMFSLAMTRVLWRARVEGSVPFGPGQGAVIVCNHAGPIDPAFVALACGRQVHWMVAREFVEGLLFGWALRILQVIPVGRGGIDTAATKLAVRYAQRGDLVGLFPEGRINETRELMLPGRPGAALIALRARVPVVPCYISGSPNDGTSWGFLFLPAKTYLKVGQPIDLSEYFDREVRDRDVLEELTKRFMVEIAALAGVPNYQPRLAGKNWKTAASAVS